MESLSIEGFQISLQQKRLWYLQQAINYQPYRVQGRVLIQGNVNYGILEIALTQVFAKHEILRTSFTTLPGMTIPLQLINNELAIKINFNDLQNLDDDTQQLKINNLVNEHNQLCFDYQNGVVTHISIIRNSANNYILLISLAAICADTLSLHNLIREISETYTACLQARELEYEPLQYADIAAWQSDLLIGEEAETAKSYWQNKKFSNLVINNLASEKQAKNSFTFNPQIININIETDTLGNLEALANQNNIDISKLFMACWQILLWRLTNKSELVIAGCFHGRNYEELQPAVGLLAKYLPVHSDFQDNYSFSEVLNLLQKEISGLEQWQDFFNWEEVFSDLQFLPFGFEFVSQSGQYFADKVSFSITEIYNCIEPFKVKLFCRYQDDSLLAQFQYDSNLFNQEYIEHLAAQFQVLLRTVTNNPEDTIAQLEILTPKERQQLLVEFNNTKTAPPPYHCIHHWIEDQANRTPNNIAVVCNIQKLTYQELNSKADKIAHILVSLGVKPETIVALYIERSIDILIGILGILKAGAAYLPLEPSLPEEALAFRLQDAQVSVVLTQSHLLEKISKLPLSIENNQFQNSHPLRASAPLREPNLFTKIQPNENKIQIICTDVDTNNLLPENILTHTKPENLAYVIYTSGSTGKPKGVAIEHRQILNYVQGILAKLDLSSPANFAIVSTFTADLGNTAIFSALCTGGCLHIISEELAIDPVAFADYNCRYSLDCLKIVPSHLSALLTGSQPEKILPRQCLIIGGEAATWDLMNRINELSPKCQILNHYGPTETTVGVLTYSVEKPPSDSLSNIVPLGRPLGNTQIYLLDNYYQPVPLGVIGEIYIGGDSVARGYINHPELTKERFIADPFRSENDARLYKTGDLARYLPDGNLEFLGRIDDQVKLHGYRIELGEIAAAIRQHLQVREVVVVAREDDFGKQQLVAYIVAEENLKSSEMRDFLKHKLPEYMLPSQFLQLKALPLTNNGKIDKKALPAPETVKADLQAAFVAPRTAVEVTLAKIWAELLNLEQVSIHDNFFELGGDSIISIQAIAKSNQVGLRLTPKQIFEHQTIAKLALVVDTSSQIESAQELIIGAVHLTPIQHGFFAQNLPEPHYYNQSFLLELKPEIDPKILQQAIQYLLLYHDALRLRFRLTAYGWEAFNNGMNPEIPFTKFDFSHIPQQQQKAAIETKATELQATLNLSNGSLIQIAHFDLGYWENSRLLIIIHHLAVDGISWRILLSDLQIALVQLQQGEKNIKLPAKTTSFKQWSECLQEYAQTKNLSSQLDYWCNQSRKQVSSLPLDYPDGINTLAHTQTVTVALNERETKTLLQEVPAKYHTQINDVLLTALVKTITNWTGEKTLLINLEGHGREDIFNNVDLSRTVGWFTTVFPVMLELENGATIGNTLKAIKEQIRTIPNRGFDYGVLRYLCSNGEMLATMPQPEICFNYLGQFDQIFQESALFTIASESSGITRSPLGNRRHLFDINGFVKEAQLQIDWTYSSAIHKQLTVSSLADKFIEVLREIINHCQFPDAGGYTPSDFSKARVSQKDLDFLLAKINQGSKK